MKKKYLASQDGCNGRNKFEHRFEALDFDEASDFVADMIHKRYFRENEQVDIYVLSEPSWSWEWAGTLFISAACEH